jgi:mannose-6-phosphate isomerase-like protein (cupin superfamily)
MFTRICAVAALLAASAVTPAAQQQQGGAPAPGATYMTEAELAAAMGKSAEAGTAMATARVANTDGYRINLIRRSAAAGAIVHADGHEVHHITDGAGTLVTGGTIIRGEGRGTPGRIEGGVTRRVAKGDVILIPVGTPHQYSAVEGSISYLEIRFAPLPAKQP